MSINNKSNSTQNNLYCDVCKINIATEAEYALHEFSKKHCDNLLRIAKNKPIVSKQKPVKPVKCETPIVNNQASKVSVVTTQGNFAKYGYFIPGEVYDRAADTREFNTEYDPYLQKYAENPLKEVAPPVAVQPLEPAHVPTANVTGFKRKKKKKIRSCQICNVTLLTVPEYEAHMRSPQHSWKLKLSGMGVSAHFVKASSDFHSVEVSKDSSSSEQCESTELETAAGGTSAAVFPTLYCDICELLLNSEQQFNAHVNGKSHNENVVKKAEMKAKKSQLESPSPNQLYCFSCKVALNNLYQYNEHKFGKKHKLRCRKLMREGITIPPEERVASWGAPRIDPNKPVVYPEMYEKFVRGTQQSSNADHRGPMCDSEGVAPGRCCEPCGVSFPDVSSYQAHVQSEEHHQKSSMCHPPQCEGDKPALVQHGPRMVFHAEKPDNKEDCRSLEPDEKPSTKEELPVVIGLNDFLRCSICGENFPDQPALDRHLSTEDHARKVLEVRSRGTADEDILEMLFRDKTVVKPDGLGRYPCGVCSVTTGNSAEFHQHIASLVHKQSEEDYRRKRMTEVKSAVGADESGRFACGACRESWPGLAEYNQHLHTVKHRDGVKAEKARTVMAKKRALLLQQRRVKQKYIISGLKRKDFACWRRNCEKNPGVMVKVAGMAPDGAASRSDPQPRALPVGATEPTAGEKRTPDGADAAEVPGKMSCHPPAIKPLMTSPAPCPPRPLLPGLRSRASSYRSWSPYPPLHHFRSNYHGPRTPYPVGRYQRSPTFYPPWHGYPPCYQ